VTEGRADSPGVRAGWIVLLCIVLSVAIFLRGWQIGIQLLVDDEWHALHKLLHSDARDIASHFGLADYSIPLTLYYRALYRTIGLSELGMRLPMLLAGIGLCVFAARAVRDHLDLRSRVVWAGMLAISPMLVYHSRTARPYALTALLGTVALFAFWRWARRAPSSRVAGVYYVVATFAAGWLHLITLAFTLAPFAFEGLRCLGAIRDPRTRRDALRQSGRLVVLAIVTLVPLVAVLLPPLLNDAAAMAAKAGVDAVSFDTVYRAGLMIAGTGHAIVAFAVGLLVLLGVIVLRRRDRAFTHYLVFVCVLGAAAVAFARPAWVQHPGTYARYLEPIVPVLLLFVAIGVVAVVDRLPSRVQSLPAAMWIAALLAAGPLPSYVYYPNQFMGHALFQFDYDAAHNPYVTLAPTDQVPAFYRDLAHHAPGSLLLVEAPWSYVSNFNPQPWYQRVHRQRVEAGLVGDLCGSTDYHEYPESDTGMRMRQLVHVTAVLRDPQPQADFLVIHRRVWTLPAGTDTYWPDMDACLPRIEQALGAPVFRDDRITVFALRKP
jgi:hypothetical protein